MLVQCKKCVSISTTKSGTVCGKQRYKCKDCGCNCVLGDERTNSNIAAKKAMCVLFYSIGKSSMRAMGKIFGHNPSLIYRWIVESGLKTKEPEIAGDIKEIEFDEMWMIGMRLLRYYRLTGISLAKAVR